MSNSSWHNSSGVDMAGNKTTTYILMTDFKGYKEGKEFIGRISLFQNIPNQFRFFTKDEKGNEILFPADFVMQKFDKEKFNKEKLKNFIAKQDNPKLGIEKGDNIKGKVVKQANNNYVIFFLNGQQKRVPYLHVYEGFILNKDFPPFNAGDLVYGNVFTNRKSSEPATFLVVDYNGEKVQIPHSGRGVDYLKPVVEKEAETPEPTKAEVNTEPQSEPSSLFSTKNIVIGVVLVVGIIGVLKYKKVI